MVPFSRSNRKFRFIIAILILSFSTAADVASPRSDRDADESMALLRDAARSDARSAGGSSFRLRARISIERDGVLKPDGTYELLWSSPDEWREEFALSDFSQIRVAGKGGVWELREPAYLSLPVWQLMRALGVYGRLEIGKGELPGKIKIKKKMGGILFRCVTTVTDSPLAFVNGTPLRELCSYSDSPQLAFERYIPLNRTFEFTEYAPLGSRSFPRNIRVYDGKALAAELTVDSLEEMKSSERPTFGIPAESHWRNWCLNPESARLSKELIWTDYTPHRPVTVYGVISPDGTWHDLRVLHSGGSSSDAGVLAQVSRERYTPATCNGVPIAVDMVFRR